MSLEIVEALQQEQLAASLCARLSAQREQGGPLAAATVVIQNAGLGRWLQLGQARRSGISAGLKLTLARNFIASELQRVGLFQRLKALEGARLRWQIFELMLRRVFVAWGECAAPVARYLKEGHPQFEQRCWQLAGQMAELYEQYAMYRPAWVLAWLRDEAAGASAHLPQARWQIELLRAVQANLQLDVTEMEQRMLGLALYHYSRGEGRTSDSSLPIHVFGVSIFPPAFLGFFRRLASEREVTIYHLVCSEAYLGELPKSYRAALAAAAENDPGQADLGLTLVDNPLLIQSGQATARLQSLLLALDYPIGELSLAPEHRDATDLECLQQALRANLPEMEYVRADGSVSIHSCHSPIREVQVLQQQLLARFAAEPDLRPEDILVLAPEIADYADAIESVFGQAVPVDAAGQTSRIPYCIADRLAGDEQHCWRFFECLLDFLKGRQSFSQLAALLDFDWVCQQLGIDRDEMKDLQEVLQQVGIRWGIDGAARAQQGLAEFEAYSWDYGLQRLYDGLIFPESGAEDCAPYPMSRRMAEVVGGLTQLLRQAFRLVRARNEPRPFQEWINAVLAVVRDCVGEGARGDAWYSIILPALGDGKLGRSPEPISFETFCEIAQGAKQEPSGPSGLLRRGVTFCRMQPVRHIPAKVLCVLGLNEGAYPRQPKRIEFDLIQQQRRLHAKGEGRGPALSELHYLGDRSLRDEDRQLFLDCLLNARAQLYLSYVGQSDTDQKAHPPSLLLSELEQFLARTAEPSEREVRAGKLAAMIVRHPLQEWSRRNFTEAQPKTGEPPVAIHFNTELATLREQVEDPAPFLAGYAATATAAAAGEDLSVAQLLRFYRDPAAAFLKYQLQVNLDQLDWKPILEDEEPIEGPDSLQVWALRESVLADWLAAQERGQVLDRARYRAQMQRSLRVPIGMAGETTWSEQVVPLLDFLQDALGAFVLKKRESRCSVGHYRLSSDEWYTQSGERLILLNGALGTPKKYNPKYLLEALLRHHCGDGVSRILCLKDYSTYTIGAAGAGREAWLQAVLQAWSVGQQQALPMSLQIAWGYVEELLQHPEADARELLHRSYSDNWEVDPVRQKFGDASAAQKLCFNADSPAAPEAEWNDAFMAYAEALLAPVREWAAELKKESH
ncbi:MAG: exodeoxyribonuclease V gamma subunit [Lentimonas sp.]|jgi:exodeoxyribonuclease V gamma subunit